MLRKASARLSEQTEWIDGSTPLKSITIVVARDFVQSLPSPRVWIVIQILGQ